MEYSFQKVLRLIIGFFALQLCAAFCLYELECLNYGKRLLALDNVLYSDAFRKMQVSEENYDYLYVISKENPEDFYDYLSVLLIDNDFDLSKKEALSFSKRSLDKKVLKIKSLGVDSYETLTSTLRAIFMDIKSFPVAKLSEDEENSFSYENGWQDIRNYGGKRKHEGTDIMPKTNERGLYKILSVSDGVVENIGWLPQGGYRIGIRSNHGAYFYYAHLSNYDKEFQVGDIVKAGDALGYMGDSGYGKEGTIGKFPVHLHFGIYLHSKNGEEISINPYYVLKIIQQFP